MPCQPGTEVEDPLSWAAARNAISYTTLTPSGQGLASVLGRRGSLTGRPSSGSETPAQGDVSRVVGAATAASANPDAARPGGGTVEWGPQEGSRGDSEDSHCSTPHPCCPESGPTVAKPFKDELEVQGYMESPPVVLMANLFTAWTSANLLQHVHGP